MRAVMKTKIGYVIRALPLFVLVLGEAACANRNKLTPTHGESQREVFARQTVHPHAGVRKEPLAGFDAQDATAVTKAYRAGIKTDESRGAGGGLLLLPPGVVGADRNTGAMPPPSTPEGR